MEDAEIIGLYWARDQLAIAETETKYGPFCGKIAMNILQNREDTEECLNDTWGRAWDSIPPQRPCSLAAYLGRIVRNLALNLYRDHRAAKRGGKGFPVLLSELKECIPDPKGEGVLCGEEQLSGVIAQWLQRQAPEDRMIFLRRYWYGDSLEELAKERGTAPNRLALRMFRLRKKLRQFLEEEGVQV